MSKKKFPKPEKPQVETPKEKQHKEISPTSQAEATLQANLDQASNEGWRFILECLGTKIMAFGDGTWDIEINIPITQTDEMPNLIESKTPCHFEYAYWMKWMEDSGGFSREYPVFCLLA
jgi:hypothetical protein